MRLFRNAVITCVLLFSLFVFSCSEPGVNAKKQTYTPGLHIHTGLKYYYTINNETETNFEVNNQEIKNTNSTLVGLLYEIVSDTANGFQLKITFDSIHILAQKGDIKTEMDANHSAFSINPVEKMLGVLKGSSMLVNINSKGVITATSGYRELVEKLITSGGVSEESQKNQIRSQLNNMFGDDFIKANLESLSIFPDSALYVGDSWTKQQTISPELKLNVTTTYSLNSITDSTASIDAVSNFNNTNSTVDIMGTGVTTDLEGSQEGNYKLDMRTGLLIKGTSNTTLEGIFKIMDKDVPVKMKITKTIEAKKL